jgi:hypothetical protein
VISINVLFRIAVLLDGTTYAYPEEDISLGCFTTTLVLLGFIPGLMMMIKRCHDRDRSGWFLLIPFVNFWLFIELFFLPGTQGPNQYGPDPLSPSRRKSKKRSDKQDYSYEYGPYTSYDNDPFESNPYTNPSSEADAAYMASLEEPAKGNDILGMSLLEIAILGVLVIAICALGGFVGLNFLNSSTAPEAVAVVQPTATLVPTLAPTPTATPTASPVVKSTPIPGWSPFEFSEGKAEIWLPSSYQGGDTVAYPEIVAMTIDTFLSDEVFIADAKEMIADPNMVFFAFDTQPIEIIRFMSIYYEKIPTDVEVTMDAYLDMTLAQMQSEGLQVTDRYLTSLDYYDEVGVAIIENAVPLGEGISMNVKFSLHALRVGDGIWSIFFRTGKDEFDSYFSTIESSVRSFYIQP